MSRGVSLFTVQLIFKHGNNCFIYTGRRNVQPHVFLFTHNINKNRFTTAVHRVQEIKVRLSTDDIAAAAAVTTAAAAPRRVSKPSRRLSSRRTGPTGRWCAASCRPAGHPSRSGSGGAGPWSGPWSGPWTETGSGGGPRGSETLNGNAPGRRRRRPGRSRGPAGRTSHTARSARGRRIYGRPASRSRPPRHVWKNNYCNSIFMIRNLQACRNPGMLESRIPARCDICRQFGPNLQSV